MKKKELFDRTVSVLVKAYFENKLEPMSSCACAVGNLVAAGLGLKVFEEPNIPYSSGRFYWSNGVTGNLTNWWRCKAEYYDEEYTPIETETEIEIKATGYSPENVCNIEKAFMYKETGIRHTNNFEGLMAIIDYLMTVHEASEEEIKEAKQLFVRV